jgi:hypothetical protein
MTTEVQIQANRANAQTSTGPHTPEGKETAAQNALKHGLFAREGAILREDEREFEEYRENLLNQLIPGTPPGTPISWSALLTKTNPAIGGPKPVRIGLPNATNRVWEPTLAIPGSSGG